MSDKLPHCGEYWHVLESKDLKPSSEAIEAYPDIKKQVVQYAFCSHPHCKSRRVYFWFPVMIDFTRGEYHRIPTRQFDQEWLPRFKTDVMDPDKPDRIENFVSRHTKQIDNEDVRKTWRYLIEKWRITKALLPLPPGVEPKEIYDPQWQFLKRGLEAS